MSTWFLCKISYFKTVEDGSGKRVSDTYLLDAVSFTEAEARLYEEVSDLVPEFMVNSVTKTRYTDIYFEPNAGHWFKCKIVYTSYDEASGKEKTVSNLALVQADDLMGAHKTLTERLKGFKVPYEVADIAKTTICDVMPFITTSINMEVVDALDTFVKNTEGLLIGDYVDKFNKTDHASY